MGEAGLAVRANPAVAPSRSRRPAPRSLRERVSLARPPCFWPALPGKAPLSEIERAGLFRLADSIPGACGDEKMVALMEAMRHAPAGDVVETGSGCGRTAVLLVWLARRYGVGAVLCLDAWSDAALAEFEVDLAPFGDGGLNYLRAETGDGYGPDCVVESRAFGETRFEGRIALLHLGGAADPAAWTPRVVPGGWIIFEPDGRAAGDGAMASADAFVAENETRICAKFSAGEALFVQLRR
jgi:hypothetical protein